MNRYVKKPIAIEAVKWKGFNNDEIKDFAGDSVKIEVIREGDADNGIPPSVDCSIETLEGVMKANVGDYIIKGVNGEFYPCKQDIFEKTYLHEDDMGNISDGYHTFNELYKYRMLYNDAFFNELGKGDILDRYPIIMRTSIGSCLISLNLIRHGNGMNIRLMRPLIE